MKIIKGIAVPESWHELKVGNYLDFLKVSETPEQDLEVARFAALLGIPYEQLSELNLDNEAISILNTLAEFLQNPVETTEIMSEITIEGIPYLVLPTFLNFTFGQFISYSALLQKADVKTNSHLYVDEFLMRILIPKAIKEDEKVTDDQVKCFNAWMTNPKRKEIVRNISVIDAITITNFFLSFTANSKNSSSLSLALHQAQERNNYLLESITKTWRLNTGGIWSWITYPIRTLLKEVKYLNNHALSSSSGLTCDLKKRISKVCNQLRRPDPFANDTPTR